MHSTDCYRAVILFTLSLRKHKLYKHCKFDNIITSLSKQHLDDACTFVRKIKKLETTPMMMWVDLRIRNVNLNSFSAPVIASKNVNAGKWVLIVDSTLVI